MQRRQPSRFRLGVVIEQGYEFAPRGGDPLVVGRAETAVARVANHARPEFRFGQAGRAVMGAIIHYDGFKLHPRLPRQGGQTGAQKTSPVPIDDHHGDQPNMLAGSGALAWIKACPSFWNSRGVETPSPLRTLGGPRPGFPQNGRHTPLLAPEATAKPPPFAQPERHDISAEGQPSHRVASPAGMVTSQPRASRRSLIELRPY